MSTTAIPTNKLRFVERQVSEGEGSKTYTGRFLQQWWGWFDHGYGEDALRGEWRDVPLEKEA